YGGDVLLEKLAFFWGVGHGEGGGGGGLGLEEMIRILEKGRKGKMLFKAGRASVRMGSILFHPIGQHGFF
ncbi:MAG: hypothetical protein U1C97_01600, partial [Candidatus Gracilibacteria bacterium]|nr:hypothetical protein [Candidatus Gracilibacteria bacterium]